MIDFNKADVLLRVAERAMGYPQYKWLADAVHEELSKMEPKVPVETKAPILPKEPGEIPRPGLERKL